MTRPARCSTRSTPRPGAQRHAGAPRGLGEREHERARVGRVIAGDVEREPHRRRERRLEAAGGARQQAPHVEAEVDPHGELAVQRRGLVAVARDDERAAAPEAGIGARGIGELRGELRPRAGAAQAEPQERELAGVGLGDRREHARRDARGARPELAALEHADAVAALRRAPGDGEPDDAATDDGDVGRCGCVQRHWHLASPA